MDPAVYPLFCDKWTPLAFGPKFPALNVRCFCEVPSSVSGKELHIDARSVSRKVGCAIRLPRDIYIKVITIQYADINAKAARVYSGSNCRHINETHVDLVEPDATYGPFKAEYNVLQFRPAHYFDKLVFKLIGTEEKDE
uniref:Arrestin_C domain-containing protein n=1 Tax=Panagrellus redivivus TaxID=6233 RepID=A0A7E4VJV0_PANRE